MHVEEEKGGPWSCMYNEGNVFARFVSWGESLSFSLYPKAAEAAAFDSCAAENDAGIISAIDPRERARAMSNQLLCRSGRGPSSLWWMSSSIPVVPLGSVDLSLRHVSTTWPGHYEQWTRCQRSVSEEEPVYYTGPAGRELKNWAMKEALRLDRFTCVVLWQT